MMNLSLKKGSIMQDSRYFIYVLIMITSAIPYNSAAGNRDLSKVQDRGNMTNLLFLPFADFVQKVKSGKADAGKIRGNATNLVLMPFANFAREVASRQHGCHELPPILKCICENCGIKPEERCVEWCQSPIRGSEVNLMFGLHDLISETTGRSNCWVCSHGPYSAGGGQWSFVPVTLQDLSESLDNNAIYPDKSDRTVQNFMIDPPRLRAGLVGKVHFCISRYREGVIKGSPKYKGLGTLPCGKVPIRIGSPDPTRYPSERLAPKYSVKNCFSHGWDRIVGVWISNPKLDTFNVTMANCTGNRTHITPTIEVWRSMAFLSSVWRALPRMLPENLYYLCGSSAYKWYPYEGWGNCTVGRIVPYAGILQQDELLEMIKARGAVVSHKITEPKRSGNEFRNKKRDIPLRSARPKDHKSMFYTDDGTMVGVTLGNVISFGTAGTAYVDKKITDLADLIDNLTEIYDDTFQYVGKELKEIKKELMQHRLVLDYLTAQTGGYCLTLYTHTGQLCCSFILNDTVDDPEAIIGKHIDEIEHLKESFKTAHSGGWFWKGWDFSWLNPSNWFSGIGGWISAILMFLAKVAGFVLLLYSCFKLLMCTFSVCKGKMRRYASKRTSEMQARREYVAMTARTRQANNVYDDIKERVYSNDGITRWNPPQQG